MAPKAKVATLQPRGRALLVRRGSPPSASVAQLPQRPPGEGEVVVQLQAAALTPADTLVCQGPPSSLADLLALPPNATFVPGCFFFGEVLAVGPYVEGLDRGEPVLGVVDGMTLASSVGATDGAEAAAEEDGAGSGGCFREAVRVHFSALLPAAALLEAGLHMPAVVAHLPPMVGAVCCVASQLRLRAGEALLVLAPRLGDVAFLLQRLLLIGDAWSGPLYLILLQGHSPTRSDLERHPQLRPLIERLAAAGDDIGGMGGAAGLGSRSGFLDDFSGWSVEEHLQQRGSASMQTEQVAEALHELVGRVAGLTRGAGLDAVLALDVELAPPESSRPPELPTRPSEAEAAESAAAAVLDPPPRPATLLRTLLGALALRGRLVTNCRKVEMMPADSEHLWMKEGSLSFFNPHGLLLSGARHGALLHAVAEVAGRLARAELPVADAEVAQYRLFEQFHPAFEAVAGRGSRTAVGPGPQLVALVV